MDVGLTTGISTDSVDVAVLAQKAESLGFESFWLPEHTIVPVHTTSRYGGTADGSIPLSMSDSGDPLIGLARASAVTQHIKLGTAISLIIWLAQIPVLWIATGLFEASDQIEDLASTYFHVRIWSAPAVRGWAS